MKNVGIIGAGKVGVSLGKYFFDAEDNKDFRLKGYYSRSSESSLYASRITNSAKFNDLKSIVKVCDILIITTPDDEILNVWREVSNYKIENKIICHCSGSLSSSIFFNISNKKAYRGSIHPMLAINSIDNSFNELKNAFFSIEGDDVFINMFKNILSCKQNKYKIINGKDKAKYHLSSVFISNLFIALGNISVKLLSEYGFSEEESLDALSSLAKLNLDKFIKLGAEKSLTGPVERNDIQTIKKHINAISEKGFEKNNNILNIYRLLSLELVEIASNKHNDRNYDELIKILNKEKPDI